MNTTIMKEKANFTVERNTQILIFPNTLYTDNGSSDPYADSVWADVIHRCATKTARERLQNTITPMQRKLTMLRADGHSDKEIAKRLGMTPAQVAREIEAAGNAVRNSAPELLELIAA